MAAVSPSVPIVHPPRASGKDRRLAARFPARLLALVRPAGGAHPARQALLGDVAETGLSLLLNSPFPPGTTLEIAPLGIPFPRPLVGRVTRCQPEGNAWRLGCRFTRRVTPEELGLLAYDSLGRCFRTRQFPPPNDPQTGAAS